MTTLFATILIVCSKVNFTNLSRYSNLSERTDRRQYEKRFDFAKFNAAVMEVAIPADHARIAVMNGSFIAKSGKKTFGLAALHNGSQGRVEKGLEVSLVAVVDVEAETGYALLAEQIFAQDYFSELLDLVLTSVRRGFSLRFERLLPPKSPILGGTLNRKSWLKVPHLWGTLSRAGLLKKE